MPCNCIIIIAMASELYDIQGLGYRIPWLLSHRPPTTYCLLRSARCHCLAALVGDMHVPRPGWELGDLVYRVVLGDQGLAVMGTVPWLITRAAAAPPSVLPPPGDGGGDHLRLAPDVFTPGWWY